MNHALVRQGALRFLSSCLLLAGCHADQGGAPLALRVAATQQASGDDAILHWDALALQAVVDDHSGTYGAPEQGGPTRSSRALAIVHLAMYDAVNAIDGSFQPYLPVNLGAAVTGKAAVAAAVAQASRDTLVALYPYQREVFDRELRLVLNGVPTGQGRAEGIQVGDAAAAHILAQRASDGSAYGDTAIYAPTYNPPLPGQHQPDPTHPGQGLLTPGWGHVHTFSGIDVTAMGVRASAPPALTDPAYTAAFRDVQALGGDGVTTPTTRTPEETETGLFWAYDGTNQLGTPPVFYNQIARVIARQEHNTLIDNARLFALINVAMADSGIACWDSKYFYDYWRPVIGIRDADLDGNRLTRQEAQWTPLGAPASNRSGSNFTPPFPSYPSGHATFGGALFRILRNVYGTDDLAFRLKSDELSGWATDSAGRHRATVVRRFSSFTEGMLENGRSRIFLGIHWQFDADSGIQQGITVADHVFGTLLQPRPAP